MKNNLLHTNQDIFGQRSLSAPAILFLLAIHLGLAFAGRSIVLISTLHALLTFGIGLYIALISKHPRKIILVTAYIVGAEIFWRMTNASIFWEFGKYAIIALLLIGILREKRLHNAGLPILYFLLLCISIPLTISAYGFSGNPLQMISFNLSGPLALAVSVLYFSQVKLSLKDLQKVAWFTAIPIVSVLTLAFYNTITAANINFTSESNFLTSGGFGPNQVSAILGLGAVMMFLVIVFSTKTSQRLIASGLMLAFLVQSTLTFSRGGIYNAGICILLGSLHLLKVKKGKIGVFVLLFAIALIGVYFLYPQLDQFTGGMLTQRFADINASGRLQIAQADIEIWKQNLFLGVGPGEAAYQAVMYYGQYAAAHTEYTRLLAEHGIPGLIAIGLLILMALRAYFRTPTWESKLWTVVFLAWPLVEMSHAAMRIAAISFLFGLANAVWIEQAQKSPDPVMNKLSTKRE